jgi:hypothetical protein
MFYGCYGVVVLDGLKFSPPGVWDGTASAIVGGLMM